MDNSIGIVFINGAGLSPSIWDDLINEFPFACLTIEFPSKTVDAKSVHTVSFDDYVQAAAAQINQWHINRFVIVAHSIGACVGLALASQFKTELMGFVAIASVIPQSGKSFTNALPAPQKFIMPIVLRLFGTKPPQKSIANELCHDLTPNQASNVINGFRPESKALYLTKIEYNLPETNRLYIKLSDDRSIPPALQGQMALNLKAHQVQPINSGHLPMLSQAKALGEVLSAFINQAKVKDMYR